MKRDYRNEYNAFVKQQATDACVRNGGLPKYYVIRDIATKGVDFLLWGNSLTDAIVSLAQCHCDGIGHEVELISTTKHPHEV